jgi:hypothetical protein
MINKLKDSLKETLLQRNGNANVQKSERVPSLFRGGYFYKGLTNLFSHPLLALAEVVIGVTLLHRGITGCCSVKVLAVFEDNRNTEKIYIAEMAEPFRDQSSVGAG